MPKNCYLTDCGLQKLKMALSAFPETCKTSQKPFPANVNLSELERLSGQQRETLRKILYRTGGVNHKTLDQLFSNLGIDLEQDDCEQRGGAPKNVVIKIVVSESGIPKVIRRLSQDSSNL